MSWTFFLDSIIFGDFFLDSIIFGDFFLDSIIFGDFFLKSPFKPGDLCTVMDLDTFAPEHIFDEMADEIPMYEKEPQKYLSLWRTRYEPFVYDILKQRYGKVLDDFWKGYVPPLESEKAFVIVERRCHPNLWFILRNIAYFGQGWSIYLFCSKQNAAYCARILGDKLSQVHLRIVFTEVVDGPTGVREYNELLKEVSFWAGISAEHICVIEMDCYLRKRIPESLLEYDYVGTPWGWALQSPGGSGLTLRRRSAMLEVCRQGEASIPMQDHFAGEGMFRLGYSCMRALPEGVKTFVESYYTEDPVGVHQWWTFFFNRFLFKQDKQIAARLLTLDV